MNHADRTLILACAALAAEIRAVYELWGHGIPVVEEFPIAYHAKPWQIAPAVRRRASIAIAEGFDKIVVAYAECGTSGELDKVCRDYGITRLPGAHCFQLYAGGVQFAALQEEEAGTFYLTDYFVENFDVMVWDAMRLDEPGLVEYVFGNYRRVVHLAQVDNSSIAATARGCAQRLGLVYERRLTGRSRLESAVSLASLRTIRGGE